MCIRDSYYYDALNRLTQATDVATSTTNTYDFDGVGNLQTCLLYTSDAADERSSVDLGGRRIIKKKKVTLMTEPVTYRTHSYYV